MIPADFALYDALQCAAIAVDEAGSGRMAKAAEAWNEAVTASVRAFPQGTPADDALGVLTGACDPDRGGGAWRADLWRALDAASLAALTAMDGDVAATGVLVSAALDAAVPLPDEKRAAVSVTLGEIRRIARTQSEVSA